VNVLLGMFERIAGERGAVAVPTAEDPAGRRRLTAAATARRECGAARALPGEGWPTRRGVRGSSENDRLMVCNVSGIRLECLNNSQNQKRAESPAAQVRTE